MFKELDTVILLVPIDEIPTNSVGVIVHDYEDDNTYEVEFEQGTIQVKKKEITHDTRSTKTKKFTGTNTIKKA